MNLSGILLFCITAVAPAAALIFLSSASLLNSILIAFDNLFLFSLPIVLVKICNGSAKKIFITALSTLWTLRFCSLIAVLLYWKFTGHQFDMFFALDAAVDIPTTVNKIFPGGFRTLSLSLILLAGLVFVLQFLVLLKATQKKRSRLAIRKNRILAIAIALALFISPTPVRPLYFELNNITTILSGREAIHPLFAMPELPVSLSEPLQSVVFLQLESGNARALSGEMQVKGRSFSGNFQPFFTEIASSGVFFPSVWSGSIQTHRSLINSLCAGTNNIGAALADTPDKIPVTCLPQILADNGYSTLFYKAFDDLNYQNHALLSKKIGFESILGESIMPERRKELEWGFDDCEFYQAVFDDLKSSRSSSQGLFLYLATAAHHYPFQGQPRYPELHAFQEPELFIEYYLNSALEQDYCLGAFIEEFKAFFKGNAHLFIFADHSVPVGNRGGTINAENIYNEDFQVPLAYIPPESTDRIWKINHTASLVPALTDLPETVLELLSGTSYQNSLVPYLLESSNERATYENCHSFVQPYGDEPKIAVVTFPQKHVYFAHSKRLLQFDLERDPWELTPSVVTENLQYEDFLTTYMCKRFTKQKSLDSP